MSQEDNAAGPPANAGAGDTVVRRLVRQWRFVAWGLALIAVSLGLPFAAARLGGLGGLGGLAVDLLPGLSVFGLALLLMPFALLARRKAVRRAIVALLFLAAAGGATTYYYGSCALYEPPLEGMSAAEGDALYVRINNGMTRDEVVALLGRPRTVYTDADFQKQGSAECWWYGRGIAYIEVWLDAQGKVVAKRADSW